MIRLTLLAPQEPNIRALRAIVLYRLGNLREAKNEFEDLLKRCQRFWRAGRSHRTA